MAAPDTSPTRRRFTFYAADGRLHARNPESKVIDLGTLARQADGSWRWCLDGNQLAGENLPSPEAAMRDAAQRMGFLYLDGQFTAVGDERESPALDLSQAPQVTIELDELAPDQRMEDARV